ncbi:MAG: hypothetical protein IT270_07500 [Saprospiraceae bacterium]|nr:hypothetical protein [Saprospiraceae bacterium]
MPNILISYLYRDEGNYKSFGMVVFSNKTNLASEVVGKQLRTAMISTEFFDPTTWGFPLLEHQESTDWSEIDGVEETALEPTDKRDIADFLRSLQQKSTQP